MKMRCVRRSKRPCLLFWRAAATSRVSTTDPEATFPSPDIDCSAGFLRRSDPGCERLSCRSLFCLFFKTVSLCALPAHLPDYTLGAELAVGAGVGACLAVLKAFPAIADRHLLALNKSFTPRVISAFHNSLSVISRFPNQQSTIDNHQSSIPLVHPDLKIRKKSAANR